MCRHRGCRAGIFVIMLLITVCSVSGVVIRPAPAQVMFRACQDAAMTSLFDSLAPHYRSGASVTQPLFEPMPTIRAQTNTTFLVAGSTTLTIGYTPPDAFDDSNGPERSFKYVYACTLQYRGGRYWSTEQDAKVIGIELETQDE